MAVVKTIEVLGQVDEDHRLSAVVPREIPPGPVRFALVVPGGRERATEEDDGGDAWASGIAQDWGDELADPRQDIYDLNDGEPVDAAG
jgi:hypothetical protein